MKTRPRGWWGEEVSKRWCRQGPGGGEGQEVFRGCGRSDVGAGATWRMSWRSFQRQNGCWLGEGCGGLITKDNRCYLLGFRPRLPLLASAFSGHFSFTTLWTLSSSPSLYTLLLLYHNTSGMNDLEVTQNPPVITTVFVAIKTQFHKPTKLVMYFLQAWILGIRFHRNVS